MKRRPSQWIRLTVTALTFASAPAFAEGWYVDLGGGSASAKHNQSDLEGSDQYVRAAVGWERPDHVAYEVGALDLGQARDGVVFVEADGAYAAVKGTLQQRYNDFFMRMGFFDWSGPVCVDGDCEDEDGLEFLIGAGVGLDVGPGSLNVELNYTQLDDQVNVTMFGASYTFTFWQ